MTWPRMIWRNGNPSIKTKLIARISTPPVVSRGIRPSTWPMVARIGARLSV